MKKKGLLPVILAALLVLVSFAAIACNESKTIKAGPESGVYYCETDNGLPLEVTLHSGNKFTLSANGEILAGTYSLNNTNLTFSFDKKDSGTITEATINNDVINLKYNNVAIRFFKAVLRTVSYVSNQGSSVDSTTVLNGKPITNRPNDPTRDGFQFVGWYSDPECTKPFMFNSQIVTADMSLYALWGDSIPEKSEFTISFDLNYEGAPTITDSVQTIGRKLYDAPNPERDGFTFRGWWVSHFDDPTMLSYRINLGVTAITESATVFALWQTTQTGTTIPASPVVDIVDNLITWTSVPYANSYKIEVKNPAGATSNFTAGSTAVSQEFEFSQLGTYVVKVTAVGLTPTDLSEPATRYFKNKSLARVSLFSVVNSSVLLFNPVPNATKYYISVECGNSFHNHNHNDINIGLSTSYNFANCQMKPGGITFIVKATADGFSPSESKEFVFVQDLAKVTEFSFDSDSQLLVWNIVPFATDYTVKVKTNDQTQSFENGSSNSFSLKEFNKGAIEVTVTPHTVGFNSTESNAFSHTKTKLASPSNVAVVGNSIVWDEVDGAQSYTVNIGKLTFSAPTNVLELTGNDLSSVRSIAGDFEISVRANGSDSSSFSDPIIASNSMFESIFYTKGFASWKYVFGAAKYDVYVDEVKEYTITGSNKAAITFASSGAHTISVTPVDQNDSPISGIIASVDVLTYKVEFDARGGELDTYVLYKAFGDPVDDFPSRENSSKIGSELEGWYTAPGGATQNAAKYLFNYYVGGDLVLYAYWMPRVYSVSLEPGNGFLEEDQKTVDIVYGKHFTLPVPTVEGNGFIGWRSLPNGAGTRYTDELGRSQAIWEIESTEPQTLYPHYAEVLRFYQEGNTYAVTKGSEISLVKSVVIPDQYNGLDVTRLVTFSQDTIENFTFGKYVKEFARETFDGCNSLINFYVHEENEKYSDVNGILCNKSQQQLVRFPAGRVNAVIPASISIIGEQSFRNCVKLTDVSVPSNVKTIASEAFINCVNLRNVRLSKGLEIISEYAFSNCSQIGQITIPADVKSIGDSAFLYCANIRSITFAGSSKNDLTIFDGLFSDCINLEEVIFEEGSLLRNISKSAFANLRNLTTITIPSSVTSIGDYAFQNCANLESVFIEEGSNLATIGENVFLGTLKLREITFEGSAKLENLSGSFFAGCSTIETITLPSGLKTIAATAFSELVNLTEVTMPSTLTNVPTSLFDNCIKLENIHATTSSSANFSSQNGILYNSDITTLVRFPLAREGAYMLPDTVNTIIDGAFRNCNLIDEISVQLGNIDFAVENGALLSYDKTVLFFYPPANTSTEFEVPASVVKITAHSFSGNKFLQTISFAPNSTLETIGDFAFNNCFNLSSLVLPDSVASIGNSAFNGCEKLNNMSIAPGTTSITARRFAGFAGLVSIFIPKSVISIETAAFENCVSLQSVVFEQGSSLESIAANAFRGCISLGTFTFPSTIKTIGSSAFQGSGLTQIEIPNTITKLENYTFAESKSLSVIVFKGGSTKPQTMGTHVFFGCNAISSVTFEENSNFKNIGSYAFSETGNINFTTISIPNSLETIDDYAFYKSAVVSGVSSPYYYGLVVLKLPEFGVLRTIGNHAFEHSALSSLTIPTSVETIGDYAFYSSTLDYNTLTSIDFKDSKSSPSKLTSIGEYAFHYVTSISKAIVFPSSLQTIGKYAFYYASSYSGGIPSITLNSSLVSIGDYAFTNCYSLKSITFSGESSLESIGSGAFQGCSGLSGKLTLPNSLTSLGISAFQNASINQVELSTSLSVISSSAFAGCNITSITIPANIVSIESSAFQPFSVGNGSIVDSITFAAGSKLTSISNSAFLNHTGSGPSTVIDVPATLPIENIISALSSVSSFSIFQSNKSYSALGGVLFNQSQTTLLRYPAGRSGAYTVPASVTQIGEGAFRGASKLTTVTFASNTALKSIGNYAFASDQVHSSKLTTLKSITIPDSVTHIGDYAFQNCTSLTTLTITTDSKLESIGKNAFDNAAFTEITIPNSLKTIGADAFARCNLKIINIDPNRTDFKIENDILFDKNTNTLIASIAKSLGDYVLPESVTVITNDAFRGRDITSIFIHKNVTSIGNYAFEGCSKLTKVEFEAGSELQSIGSYAFSSCTSLNSINLEVATKLKTISSYAFHQTSSNKFSSISLPASLETISSYAFSNTALKTIVFTSNSNLGVIGNYAFYYAAVNSMNFPQKLTSIGEYAFANTKLAGTLNLPASLVNIGIHAFENNGQLTKVKFDDRSTIQTIAARAFQGCTSLATVDFGVNSLLSTIGVQAFSGCGLTSFTFPAQMSGIGSRAFEGCSSLENFYTEENSINYAAENGVLFNKAKTAIALYPTYGKTGSTYVVPSYVNTIGYSAFSTGNSAKLKSVILHNSITTIKSYAFQYYSGELTIALSVTTIEDEAFNESSSATLYIQGRTMEQAPSGWSKFWLTVPHPNIVWNV